MQVQLKSPSELLWQKSTSKYFIPFKLGWTPCKNGYFYAYLISHISFSISATRKKACENEIHWTMFYSYQSKSTDIHFKLGNLISVFDFSP